MNCIPKNTIICNGLHAKDNRQGGPIVTVWTFWSSNKKIVFKSSSGNK